MPNRSKVEALIAKLQQHAWNQYCQSLSNSLANRQLRPDVKALVEKIIANPDDADSIKRLASLNPRIHSLILGMRMVSDAFLSNIESLSEEITSDMTLSPKIIERNKKATQVACRARTERSHQHYAQMAHRVIELIDGLGFTQRDAADVLNREGYRTQKGQKILQSHIQRHMEFFRKCVESNPQNPLS